MGGKVFFSPSMSLDGFIAPDSPEELVGRQWMELQRRARDRALTRAVRHRHPPVRGVDAGRVALEPLRSESTPRVTHLTYAVRER